MTNSDLSFKTLEDENRVIIPFVACGDLSAYDSDMTYDLAVCLRTEYCLF